MTNATEMRKLMESVGIKTDIVKKVVKINENDDLMLDPDFDDAHSLDAVKCPDCGEDDLYDRHGGCHRCGYKPFDEKLNGMREEFDAHMSDETDGEDDFDWQSEMEHGITITDITQGGYDISAEGKYIDNVKEMDDALLAVGIWMDQNQYYPNVFFINDHGNVTQIDKDGNEISSIVEQGYDPMADEPDFGVQDDITSDPRKHLSKNISYSIKVMDGSHYDEPDEVLIWRHEGGTSSAIGNPGEVQSEEQAEQRIAQDAKSLGIGKNYNIEYR